MSRPEIIELDPSRADWLPYAPAVRIPHGSRFVYLPGAVRADDPAPSGDVVEQTREVMRRHTAALAEHGLGWADVVHVFEFLTDMRETGPVHLTMDEFFGGTGWKPANTLVGVNALSQPGARFELDVIAVRPPEDEDDDGAEPSYWMSGATAIPLYHMHPHVEEQCVLPDDIREQTRRVLATFDEVLEFIGRSWADVTKCSLFLTDLRDHAVFRELFDAHLGAAAPPISLVGINHLSAPGARLELELSVAGVDDPQLPVFLPALSAGPGSAGLPEFADQLAAVFDSLDAELAERQLERRDVAKLLVHLTDVRDAGEVRAAIAARFDASVPALTIVQVDGLPFSGARVQLDAIAQRS